MKGAGCWGAGLMGRSSNSGNSSNRDKYAVVSTQYADVAESLDRNVEPNCIRLEKTCQGMKYLPARRSMRRQGRVCEGIKVKTEVEEGGNPSDRPPERIHSGRLESVRRILGELVKKHPLSSLQSQAPKIKNLIFSAPLPAMEVYFDGCLNIP